MADCNCQIKFEYLDRINDGGPPLGGWICPVHGQIDYAAAIFRRPRDPRPPADDRLIREKPCPTCGIEREDLEKAGEFYCPACKLYF